MLMLNPLGGAMLMRSIGMFLQGGRRGSKPQAHTLIHQETRSKLQQAAAKSAQPQAPQIFRPPSPKLLSSKKGSKPKPLPPKKKPKPKMAEAELAVKQVKKPTTQTGGANKSQPKIIENLKKRTHFTRQEIESLCKVYKKLVTSAANNLSKNAASSVVVPTPGMPSAANRVEGLDRVVFRELIHNTFDLVTEEVLIDRIFCAFDRNNDGVVKLDNWVCGLSTFLRGTQEERTSFCFLVYDLNGDGFITREEMVHLLRNCLIKSPQDEDPEEGVRDLVELALRKLDVDKDGKISYQDFLEAVTEEPLLLEAFGQCLPAENACQTFISTLHC